MAKKGLSKLLNISDLQLGYITNVGAGQGLLKVGSFLVPIVNKFPRNTELYRLMMTMFGEVQCVEKTVFMPKCEKFWKIFVSFDANI